MIEKIVVDVTDNEYDKVKPKILSEIPRLYLDKKVHKMIKGIVEQKIVGNLIIENPYYDTDYLSTYYSFYSRKHNKYIKECIRIHYFSVSAEYLGYMTLRPTVEHTNIGKTYLSPKLYLPNDSRVITTVFKAHIFGFNTMVNAFPWMQQETDVAVCAHVAIWSILRYFGTKYPRYQSVTMGNVVEKLPEDIERKIPTSAVSTQKIPDIFKIMGFSPIVVSRSLVGEERFEREMLAYLESGIPIVACMTGKRHAVSVIGYVKYDNETIKRKLDNVDSLLYNIKMVKEVVVNDDNFSPYLKLRRKENINPFYSGNTFSKNERFIEDIDFLIIPLYERMHYSFASLFSAIKDFLEQEKLLNKDQKYIVKEYIASANAIKTHASVYIDNARLKDTIIKMTMPRFVWCVDFLCFNSSDSDKIHARLIIDTTCCNKDNEPWLLMHNDVYVRYRDESKWSQIDTKIDPYHKFENLSEVN